MEKLIYLLWKPQDQTIEVLRNNVISTVSQQLTKAGASKIRLTISDSDVNDAHKKRLVSAQLPAPLLAPHALVSFWLNSASDRHEIEKILVGNSTTICGYLVTESEPLINTQHTQARQRTAGMNQVVFLRKPARLTREEWLDLWLNHHTPIAIATQSTFGYRQNIVTRLLTDNALTQTLGIDAIVEENFPAEAMTSAHVFYKAVDNNGKGDDKLLRKNQTEMFASVQRFIDLDKLDCLPMSEYNF